MLVNHPFNKSAEDEDQPIIDDLFFEYLEVSELLSLAKLPMTIFYRHFVLQSLIGEESLEKRKNRVFTSILTLKRLHVSRDLIPKILQSNHFLERDLLTVLYDFYFVSSQAKGACPNFHLNFMRAKIASHVPKIYRAFRPCFHYQIVN